jgi:hypothetical protein
VPDQSLQGGPCSAGSLGLCDAFQLSHVEKHFPAALLVSIGCSVAFSAVPLAFTVRTMS